MIELKIYDFSDFCHKIGVSDYALRRRTWN